MEEGSNLLTLGLAASPCFPHTAISRRSSHPRCFAPCLESILIYIWIHV